MVLGRDGFTYSYHNYLGPANTIYKDDEPMDEADLDAYFHDLEYELASSDQDIRDTDREAKNNFICDFKKDYSFAEFTGIVGLSLKYGFESVFGVVHPFNISSDKTLSQLIYASRERHIASEWNRIKNTPDKGCFRDYRDFKASALIVKEIYESYKVGGFHCNLQTITNKINLIEKFTWENINITTPLALIPVDFLPFYISEAEFDMLSSTAKVTIVSCCVTPLGKRTVFDLGATLSGTATSEYVPIGLVAEVISKEFYGRNLSYTAVSTDPMKVTGLKTMTVSGIND
ncbi:unnamed protein product [Ceratitis capitata]|uniref:(Mediterranean fruit fly) hypothetical protein n=1 Tax=Ceratitis capitata TaxID=7213 RepID=A0A811UU04_CERCA|nr:unnamed protein product [Ceratitis capitata]